MFIQAWSTYWKSYNPKRFGENNKKMSAFEFGFWAYLIFGGIQESEAKAYMAIKVIPLVLMLWNNFASKFYMPKAIYLSPMGEEGRKQYINALLLMKIGVPTVVNMVLHIVYAVFYEFSLFAFVSSAFAQLSSGIGMYICCEMRSKYDRYIRYAVPGKDGTGKDAWLNYFCMGLGMIGSIFCGIEANRLGILIFDITLLAIFLIMDIGILKTRYQVTVDYICDYEESRNILGKVK